MQIEMHVATVGYYQQSQIQDLPLQELFLILFVNLFLVIIMKLLYVWNLEIQTLGKSLLQQSHHHVNGVTYVNVDELKFKFCV